MILARPEIKHDRFADHPINRIADLLPWNWMRPASAQAA
jgi:hypothetical protein